MVVAIKVDRNLNYTNVIDALTEPFILRGLPMFISSENGPKFFAQAVRDLFYIVGARTAYIKLRRP